MVLMSDGDFESSGVLMARFLVIFYMLVHLRETEVYVGRCSTLERESAKVKHEF